MIIDYDDGCYIMAFIIAFGIGRVCYYMFGYIWAAVAFVSLIYILNYLFLKLRKYWR